jgi:acyl-CoA synthetase (AMP-forming)/AMP-acid ligase II
MNRILSATLERYETEFAGRHLLHDVIAWWAAHRPHDPAIINATRHTQVDWAAFDAHVRTLASALHQLGLRKGDFLATSLPLLNEHIFLEYACFRLGVIHVPLDLRLAPAEVLRCLNLIQARGYAFLGKTAAADFSALGEAVRSGCPSVEHLLQFAAPEECISGARPFASVFSLAGGALPDVSIEPDDAAQVIFTTGSTGSPKAALLSHRGITAQNLALGSAFEFGNRRVLVNLPPSHVGCQAELLMTTFFMGGTAVTLEIFDAAKSLDAIERYRVQLLGQIPAMFQMMWRTSGYANRDLTSLQAAVYGGQSVPLPFLERMRTMAPAIGTGLGLTETSGFCTYTPLSSDPAQISASIGHAAPIYEMSVRAPMETSGQAGRELADGQTGHVCFRGPQHFLGYVNDPEATARTISRDGWLYPRSGG